MSNEDRFSDELTNSTEEEVNSIENITGQIRSEIDPSLRAEGKIKPITGNINETDAKIKISQESTRSRLAYSLFITYGVTILLVLSILLFTDKIDSESRKEIIVLILTSQSTIIGSALGFYFAKEK